MLSNYQLRIADFYNTSIGTVTMHKKDLRIY